MDSNDKAAVAIVFALVLAGACLIGGCMSTVHREQMTKYKLQAEGKLPPDNTNICRLDDNQLQQIIEAIKEANNDAH